MIRYLCDLCKRELDPDEDIRYVVKMEILAAFDPSVADEEDDDRDHLQEIQGILERLEQSADQVGENVYQQLRFDLCPECRKRFVENPLGREIAKVLDFSKNVAGGGHGRPGQLGRVVGCFASVLPGTVWRGAAVLAAGGLCLVVRCWSTRPDARRNP